MKSHKILLEQFGENLNSTFDDDSQDDELSQPTESSSAGYMSSQDSELDDESSNNNISFQNSPPINEQSETGTNQFCSRINS